VALQNAIYIKGLETQFRTERSSKTNFFVNEIWGAYSFKAFLGQAAAHIPHFKQSPSSTFSVPLPLNLYGET
jgi:hypothetical protein